MKIPKGYCLKSKKCSAYLIYTSTENIVPLLVPLECKYGPFVLPQGARQISWWMKDISICFRDVKSVHRTITDAAQYFPTTLVKTHWPEKRQHVGVLEDIPSFVHILANPSYEPVARRVPSLCWRARQQTCYSTDLHCTVHLAQSKSRRAEMWSDHEENLHSSPVRWRLCCWGHLVHLPVYSGAAPAGWSWSYCSRSGSRSSPWSPLSWTRYQHSRGLLEWELVSDGSHKVIHLQT